MRLLMGTAPCRSARPPCAIAVAAIVGAIALSAAPAAAQDSELKDEQQSDADGVEKSTGKTLQERIRAVSRRVFLKRQRFELAPLFGFSANDPLNRSWTFGGRGSFHFNEEFAIDFGGAGGFNEPLIDVRLIDPPAEGDGLEGARAATPLQVGYADVGVTFSPFYGKMALMAEQVLHFDGFISGGLGAVIDSSPDIGVHPAIELGIGGRMFLTKWLSVRGDVRNYTYPQNVGNKLTFPSALILTLGVGIFLPLDFDYSTEIIGAKG
jgi:outer membrane beta-barrel protein